MHQSHNIPWQIIAENFKFVHDDKSTTPPFTGLRPKQNVQSKQLIHFVNKFHKAITDFSETERSKYPPSFSSITQGKLFSDELLEKHREYLNAQNQRIEHWIDRSHKVSHDNSEPTISYSTSHGDLADVVKVLLAENQLEPLLMLAKHPLIPLAHLRHLSWGHHFGFSRVQESALHAYIYLNCAEATDTLDGGQYAETPEYRSLLLEIGNSMDYPAQQIPHTRFMDACGIYKLDSGAFQFSYAGGPHQANDWPKDLFVHHDRPLLQSYLKDLFALMYRYDMLMKECGLDPNWAVEIAHHSPLNSVIHTEHKWIEESNSWESYII
ncbi:hypothetical protein CPB83DRAFT_809235 [Crepidotus variabilis]|uniref:Uncharacterized protein n=1 Tax=Crepidotus variabilis TaxID=179855 RepID=A0A9P6EKL3_9AGAR|nr:hypothetical protein CPB83DRAFT_809235 [Crepidotus variabilis]